MNLMIHQILPLFFIFPVIIHSKNSCPISSCGNSYVPIKYPFKLESDEPPRKCDSIDVRCNDEGRVVINLPSSGDFYVTSIDYALQTIYLTDPGDCLLGRLMMTSISVYPLYAFYYVNYTYYMCPKERLRDPFTEIHCLSNSTNATIATTDFSSEFMKDMFGCEPIVSSLIPVLWSTQFNYSGDLPLSWNVSRCRECDQYGPPDLGDSKSKLAKIIGSPAFITIIVLVTFFGIAWLVRIAGLLVGRATGTEDAATSTTATPPQATGDTRLPETTTGTIGTGNSEIKNYSEVSEGEGASVSCPICLEEYCGKDKVRNLGQCGHYFHVECIDQWQHKCYTCPVCRTSLS